MGSIPGLERPPGGGNRNPLKYSCLKNSMEREAWWATVHGVAKKSDMIRHTHINAKKTHTRHKLVCPKFKNF